MKRIFAVLLCLLLLPPCSSIWAEESSPYGYVAKLAIMELSESTPTAPQFITLPDKETAEAYLKAGLIEYYEVNFPVYLPEDVLAPVSLQSTLSDTPHWQYTAVNYPASALSTGQGVTIGILDSGINPHEAFGARLLSGYNVLDGTTDTTDRICHGTRVAGMAAAMAPEVNLLPIKAFDSNKSTYVSDILLAMNTGIEAGCDILNMSLGFDSFATTEQAMSFVDTLAYAEACGILVVAAVGNKGTTAPMYPAGLPGVIGVGAVSRSGDSYTKAYYSQYNEWVDIVAPGSCVGFPDKDSTDDYVTNSDTEHINGTSFACPMISGILALGLSYNRTLPPTLVKDTLLQSTLDLGDTGVDNLYGYGLADVTGFFEKLTAKSDELRAWKNIIYISEEDMITDGVSVYNAEEKVLKLCAATYTEDFRELTEFSQVTAPIGHSFLPVTLHPGQKLFLLDGLKPLTQSVQNE